jgi:menaquinone-dependent protoporphyrinogen oxidase
VRVLVAYASRMGSTGEIAQRIAERLRAAGHETRVELVIDVPWADVAAYDAFVVGSAVYIGRWQKEAVQFVQGNRAVLADRPTWLFSSGPLGSEPTDAKGRDKREGALLAEELETLTEAVRPRDHRVFPGVLNPDRLSLGPRLMRLMPAGRKLLEEGDFRDWSDIEAWTDVISGELAEKAPVGANA